MKALIGANEIILTGGSLAQYLEYTNYLDNAYPKLEYYDIVRGSLVIRTCFLNSQAVISIIKPGYPGFMTIIYTLQTSSGMRQNIQTQY